MRRRLYSLSLSSLVLLLASCEVPPGGGSVVPSSYSECDDVEAMDAWRRAKLLVGLSRDTEALPLLVLATSKCPDLIRAHIAYQDVAKRLGGEHHQAMVDFYVQGSERASGGRSPVPAYLRARLAETAYAQSNALDKILASHANFAWGYLSLGRVNRGQGRLSEALRNYDKAIVSDSNLLEARLERAQVLTELGRDQESAVAYKSYVRQMPSDSAAVREYITLLLYRLGRVDEALLYLDLLAQRGETSLALRMDRAAALWRLNRLQAAVEIYLEILAAEPANARAALNIGLLYYEIVPKDEAAKLRYWPKARVAFELFLQGSEPADGHEQFERMWAVPHRLQRVRELLGPSTKAATIEALAWPKK